MTADEEDINLDILKEKIRSLQEKYREHEELFSQTKLTDESPERELEVDRFQDIFKGLLPCKLELSNIEEDLRNLKRRYKTPQEYLEGEKSEEQSHSPLREKVRPRRDSYRANEEDVKHMVMDNVGRSYRVNVPLSVLNWDSLDDDFLINNDLVLCKVRIHCSTVTVMIIPTQSIVWSWGLQLVNGFIPPPVWSVKKRLAGWSLKIR